MISFLLGATAGAVIALLTTPYSGDETRRMISDKFHSGENKIKGYANEAKGMMHEAVGKIQNNM